MKRRILAVIGALVLPVSSAAQEIVTYPDSTFAYVKTDASRSVFGLAALVERTGSGTAAAHTNISIGAEVSAVHHAGVHQIAFGIATEAWALAGSLSPLTGLEASTINLEPNNAYRKISLWSTFKNRPDTEYWNPPADAMNVGTQALRIESQIGTGFERGIVFDATALHRSRTMARPAALDFSELSDDDISQVDLIRIRKDVTLRYDVSARALVLHFDE